MLVFQNRAEEIPLSLKAVIPDNHLELATVAEFKQFRRAVPRISKLRICV